MDGYYGQSPNNIVVQRPQMPQQMNGAPTPVIGRPRPAPIRTVYSQKTTKNKSFLDMHHYLKSIGIKNNEFMLALIDPDLDGINPHDPHLNAYMKQKVFRECMCNYWYYLREIVRIPDQGGQPIPFKLTRANLAVNFCMALNLNVFEEIPRRICCRLS